MNRNRLAILGGALLVVLLVAAFVASPWLAAARLTQALRNGDATAIDRLVDFRAVRNSLSSQLTSRIIAESREETGGAANPFGGLVALVAPAIVNQMVAFVVTPEGLARLSRASREVKAADDRKGGKSKARRPKAERKPKLGYTGLNSFAATYEVEGEGAMVWVMGRENLFFWRLKEIRITDAVFEDLELERPNARR